MAKFEILMPKMGESIIEATITRWLKKTGETVNEDDAIAEIATDKVDSEIPSPVEGILEEILFKEGDVVPVGKVIAVINLGGEADETKPAKEVKVAAATETAPKEEPAQAVTPSPQAEESYVPGDRFYSPLVKSIAKKENISPRELDSIAGTGKDGRLTKADLLEYLSNRTHLKADRAAQPSATTAASKPAPSYEAPKVTLESGDEVFEMDRMRKLIADHMVMSKQVSPHVTSFIDVDVTNIVMWREKVKESFLSREGEKLTYTPILIEAAAQVLKEFPRVNASVDGYNIIHRKKINIGMATALPNGNLIVPVIRSADQKNLLGIVKDVNDLANRARNNSLIPDEIQGGTFTVTNFGTLTALPARRSSTSPRLPSLASGPSGSNRW